MKRAVLKFRKEVEDFEVYKVYSDFPEEDMFKTDVFILYDDNLTSLKEIKNEFLEDYASLNRLYKEYDGKDEDLGITFKGIDVLEWGEDFSWHDKVAFLLEALTHELPFAIIKDEEIAIEC